MTRFFTFRRNVPLKAGQVLHYTAGKGYWAFGAVRKTVARAKPKRKKTTGWERLAALMDQLVAHEPQVHYAEVRPMRTVHLRKPVYPMTMDCSESVTCLYKWAGLHDPNNLRFNGTGNTETLAAHGTEVAVANGRIGDLLVFLGPMAHQHVCMIRQPGADPLLFSHGQEAGPMYLRLSAERTAHVGQPITVRSYL